jgi:hypothetical protein
VIGVVGDTGGEAGGPVGGGVDPVGDVVGGGGVPRAAEGAVAPGVGSVRLDTGDSRPGGTATGEDGGGDGL